MGGRGCCQTLLMFRPLSVEGIIATPVASGPPFFKKPAMPLNSSQLAGDSNDLSMNKPIYAADEARKPLMAMMDKVGMGSSMDSAGINVYGFVEGGWTYNFDTPNNQTNVGRVFDFEDQDKTLNQVDLT